MKGLLNSIILGGVLIYSPAVSAAAWVEVSIGATGDRVLVDQDSIQRTDRRVEYWEYRDVQQAQLGSGGVGSQPTYGMMIYRSVDCAARTSRVQRLVLFNQNQEVIRRVSYEGAGGLARPVLGSNVEASFRYVCESGETATGHNADAN